MCIYIYCIGFRSLLLYAHSVTCLRRGLTHLTFGVFFTKSLKLTNNNYNNDDDNCKENISDDYDDEDDNNEDDKREKTGNICQKL